MRIIDKKLLQTTAKYPMRMFEIFLRRYWRTVSFCFGMFIISFFWYVTGQSSNLPESMKRFNASVDTLNSSINRLTYITQQRQEFHEQEHRKFEIADSVLLVKQTWQSASIASINKKIELIEQNMKIVSSEKEEASQTSKSKNIKRVIYEDFGQ